MILPEKIVAMFDRMNYLITYSLIRFIKAVAARFFHPKDLFYVSTVGMFVCMSFSVLNSKTSSFTHSHRSFIFILDTFHYFCAILFVDVLMGNIQGQPMDGVSMSKDFTYWVTATSAVLVIPVVCKAYSEAFKETTVTTNLQRLVLFMYAENSVFLTKDMEIDKVMPIVAMMSLIYIRRVCCAYNPSFVVSVLVQATTMVFTNVVVSTVLRTDDVAADSNTEIVWLLSLLILFDATNELLVGTSDLRDYAIWKSAANISVFLQYRGLDNIALFTMTMLVVVTLKFVSLPRTIQHMCVLGDVSVLIAINTCLYTLENLFKGLPYSVLWVFLVCILNGLHYIMSKAKSNE